MSLTRKTKINVLVLALILLGTLAGSFFFAPKEMTVDLRPTSTQKVSTKAEASLDELIASLTTDKFWEALDELARRGPEARPALPHLRNLWRRGTGWQHRLVDTMCRIGLTPREAADLVLDTGAFFRVSDTPRPGYPGCAASLSEATPYLVRALEDPQRGVRAAEVLGRVIPDEKRANVGTSALLRLVKDPRHRLHEAAYRALAMRSEYVHFRYHGATISTGAEASLRPAGLRDFVVKDLRAALKGKRSIASLRPIADILHFYAPTDSAPISIFLADLKGASSLTRKTDVAGYLLKADRRRHSPAIAARLLPIVGTGKHPAVHTLQVLSRTELTVAAVPHVKRCLGLDDGHVDLCLPLIAAIGSSATPLVGSLTVILSRRIADRHSNIARVNDVMGAIHMAEDRAISRAYVAHLAKASIPDDHQFAFLSPRTVVGPALVDSVSELVGRADRIGRSAGYKLGADTACHALAFERLLAAVAANVKRLRSPTWEQRFSALGVLYGLTKQVDGEAKRDELLRLLDSGRNFFEVKDRSALRKHIEDQLTRRPCERKRPA